MKKFLLFIALILFSATTYSVEIDVNVYKIDTYLDGGALPPFSYYRDGNLTIDFNIQSDTNTVTIDINYSTSNLQGTGTKVIDDYNLGASTICTDTDFTNQTTCSYDLNITLAAIADGNYFILIDANASGTSDFNASDQNFMVDNTKPSTSWDGNTVWKNTDQNNHLTCNKGTGSACATTQYRADTNAATGVSLGAWTAYSSQVLFSTDGNYQFDFNSTDAAGNIGDTNTFYVLLDKNAAVPTNIQPSTTATIVGVTQTYSIDCSDATSGVYNAVFTLYKNNISQGDTNSSSVSGSTYSKDFIFVYDDTGYVVASCIDNTYNESTDLNSATITFYGGTGTVGGGGGTPPAKVANGMYCASNGDCLSNYCLNGICAAIPTSSPTGSPVIVQPPYQATSGQSQNIVSGAISFVSGIITWVISFLHNLIVR